MTTRNKRKLAALNKENCEDHPRSNLAQNSSAPRSQEDYITQVSEEIEGRVTKKLSKEFSRTENRILGALARLDNFLMNPLLPGGSGTTPEPSRNALSISQGTNEDDSQNDPPPEAGLFHGQMTQTSGLEDGHYTNLFGYHCSRKLSVQNYVLYCYTSFFKFKFKCFGFFRVLSTKFSEGKKNSSLVSQKNIVLDSERNGTNLDGLVNLPGKFLIGFSRHLEKS